MNNPNVSCLNCQQKGLILQLFGVSSTLIISWLLITGGRLSPREGWGADGLRSEGRGDMTRGVRHEGEGTGGAGALW